MSGFWSAKYMKIQFFGGSLKKSNNDFLSVYIKKFDQPDVATLGVLIFAGTNFHEFRVF